MNAGRQVRHPGSGDETSARASDRAIETKRRTGRRGRPDNADEMSARASDRDAGQGTTDQTRDRARTAEQRTKRVKREAEIL